MNTALTFCNNVPMWIEALAGLTVALSALFVAVCVFMLVRKIGAIDSLLKSKDGED